MRTTGVEHALPRLEDGRVLPVANVIWCTGFNSGLTWIKLPISDSNGHPNHERGIVPNERGLYFVGRHFQYAVSSGMIHGVERDADFVVRHMLAHRHETSRCAQSAASGAWRGVQRSA